MAFSGNAEKQEQNKTKQKKKSQVTDEPIIQDERYCILSQ